MSHTRLRPSFSFTDEKLAELRRVVPEAFADGRVNWDSLREALGAHLEDDDAQAEHFGLNWPGKREARRMAGSPSKGALVPQPGKGVNEDSTRNVFIEGENLEVLKLMQKAYAGKVKMIYIDPPYNTGNDFVYEDDFTEPLEEYLRRTGQVDEEGRALTTNTRADGRFHSKWLSMMYPRLRLARQLLRDDGVIFVSIDDNEVHHLRALMSEVFGDENFIAQLIWEKGRKNDAKLVSIGHEYMLLVAKSKTALSNKNTVWREAKPGAAEIQAEYNRLKAVNGSDTVVIQKGLREFYGTLAKTHPSKKLVRYNNVDSRGVWRDDNISWPGGGGPTYDVLHPETGKPCAVPEGGWRYTTPEKFQEQVRIGKVVFRKDHTEPPIRKTYLVREADDADEVEGDEELAIQVAGSYFYRSALQASNNLLSLFGAKYFENPKDHEVLMRWIRYVGANNKDDIIIDFFAGSGSTGQAVQELNDQDDAGRKFLLVQLPEIIDAKHPSHKAGYRTIADISRERLKRAFAKNKSEAGFLSFGLGKSHYRAWRDVAGADLTALEKAFAAAESPLVEGWSPAGLRTEVMLLEGFPLDSRVEHVAALKKNEVQRIHHEWHAHALLVCLDQKIHADTIAGLQLGDGDIFICLDTAIDDQSKLRLSDKGMIKTI